jgi:predicted restriction endonuclease
MVADSCLSFLKRVAQLQRAPNTKRATYVGPGSPYKPLLLLVVIRRIQQGHAPYINNRITYPVCLRDFSALYSKVYGDSSNMEAKVAQPFWNFAGGKPKLWELVAKPGMEGELSKLLSSRVQIKTGARVKSVVEAARFTEEDWRLLCDADVQQALISFILAAYFTDVKRELETL